MKQAMIFYFRFTHLECNTLDMSRCSTPKVPDLVKKGKVIHSPASSIIKEVDSTGESNFTNR